MKVLKTVEHPSPDFENKFGVMVRLNQVHDIHDLVLWSEEKFHYEPIYGQDQDYIGVVVYFWFLTEADRSWFILKWSN